MLFFLPGAVHSDREEQDLVALSSSQDEALGGGNGSSNGASTAATFIALQDTTVADDASSSAREVLLAVENLTLRTPNGRVTLVRGLDLKVGLSVP